MTPERKASLEERWQEYEQAIHAGKVVDGDPAVLAGELLLALTALTVTRQKKAENSSGARLPDSPVLKAQVFSRQLLVAVIEPVAALYSRIWASLFGSTFPAAST